MGLIFMFLMQVEEPKVPKKPKAEPKEKIDKKEVAKSKESDKPRMTRASSRNVKEELTSMTKAFKKNFKKEKEKESSPNILRQKAKEIVSRAKKNHLLKPKVTLRRLRGRSKNVPSPPHNNT